jgi:hypothetical protein
MQTTSFELSEKLKEVGIKFSCPTYYWCYYVGQIHLFRNSINSFDNAYDPISNVLYITERHQIRPEKENGIAAYTLDEILEMLSSYFKHYANDPDPWVWDILTISKYQNGMYRVSCKNLHDTDFIHKNPTEAAGQLLVWCIENDYIKLT